MKARDFLFRIVGGVAGVFALAVLYVVLSSTTTPTPAPFVAGQRVPQEHVSLHFTNRLTFYCSSSREFHNCRIVGFTGGTGDREPSISRGYDYFDHWIVLEEVAGHRFYIRPSDIQYIEEDTTVQK